MIHIINGPRQNRNYANSTIELSKWEWVFTIGLDTYLCFWKCNFITIPKAIQEQIKE